MPGIYNRDHLDDAERRDLSRQQFNNLNSEDDSWFKQAQVDLNDWYYRHNENQESRREKKILLAEPVNTKILGVVLSRGGLCTIICDNQAWKEPLRPLLSEDVVDSYVREICKYVNSVRSSTAVPFPTHSPRHGYRNVKPLKWVRPIDGGEHTGGCMAIDRLKFRSIKWDRRHEEIPGRKSVYESKASAINKLFHANYNHGREFMEMDYILAPYRKRSRRHWMLPGWAPQQKFAFIIDTIPIANTWRYNHQRIAWGVEAVLLHHIRAAARNYSIKDSDWPLYTEWSDRGQTQDGSPNGSQQRDGYNCALFLVTTAFCLAFGFDLLCWAAEDLDPLKRPRMAAELVRGGMVGMAEYDMFELPTQFPNHAAQFHQVPTHKRTWPEEEAESDEAAADTEDEVSGNGNANANANAQTGAHDGEGDIEVADVGSQWGFTSTITTLQSPSDDNTALFSRLNQPTAPPSTPNTTATSTETTTSQPDLPSWPTYNLTPTPPPHPPTYNHIPILPTNTICQHQDCHRTLWLYSRPPSTQKSPAPPHPPQFPPTQFRRSILIFSSSHYPPQSLVPSDPGWWLSTGCEQFGIAKWMLRDWAREERGLFHDWVTNRVRAWFALFLGEVDMLVGMDGVEEGFRTWDRREGFDVEHEEREGWVCALHRSGIKVVEELDVEDEEKEGSDSSDSEDEAWY